MRELKFRAWDKFNKQIENDCGLERAGNYHQMMDNPLMQWTGLKDKNGKEIYESDLLKDEHGRWGEVIFQCGAFTCDIYDGIGLIEESDAEVIGNVYQNPPSLCAAPVKD